MRKDFKFVETKKTEGIVEEIKRLATVEDVSVNKYVGRILTKHVEDIKEHKD